MTTTPRARLPWGYLVALAALLLVLTHAVVVREAGDGRPRRSRRADAAPVASGLTVEAPAPGPEAAVPLPIVASPWWLALALTPAALLVFSLFHPDVAAALRAAEPRRVALLAGAIVLWTLVLPAVDKEPRSLRLDPYKLAIATAIAVTPLLALRLDREPGRLTALGLLVWLAWWIPFDLRWAGQLWLGPQGLGYAAPALLVTALGLLGFGVMARTDAGTDDQDPLRPPTLRDLGQGLGLLVGLGAVVIPLGLLTGFLSPHAPKHDAARVVLELIAVGVTIALPEEVYFRAILDAGLRARLRAAPSLVISSVAFGLMHWNNRADLNEQLAYLLLATIAGGFYGLAYRRGGLFAAVLCHTLVDVVWKAVL